MRYEMATYNPRLEILTLDDIETISEHYLMGWHDLYEYGFRIKDFNRKRMEHGLSPLTKEDSLEYRINYIKQHYSYTEICDSIENYLFHNSVDKTRWHGIELFDCHFGREYAKAFKALIGNAKYHKISENTRVQKLCESPMCSQAVIKKSTDNRMQKIYDAMFEFKKSGIINDSIFKKSPSEMIVFYELIQRFGKKDVYYQYGLHPYDARYPFNCDFYIKSLDLFIEINSHYSHGNHWFDATSHDDCLRRKNLLNSTSKKSVKSVETWCDKDVVKRQKAMSSKINYLVFWDGSEHQENKKKVPNLSDFYEWFLTYDCDYKKFVKDHPENTY